MLCCTVLAAVTETSLSRATAFRPLDGTLDELERRSCMGPPFRDRMGEDEVAHNVSPTKRSCMGILSQSGGGVLPRIGTPFLGALTLAGNIATKRSARQRSASPLVAGTSRPTAPKPCWMPVRLTRRAGLGNVLGTVATRSPSY